MNRSPGLAGVLSVVFPGLGHLYAGATARGLALAGAFIALLQEELVPFVLAVWIFGIVNAIRTAEEIVRAQAEGRPAAVSLDRNWATGLMAAGVLATLALIPDLEWALRFWPLLLVWVGFRLYQGQPVIPGSAAASAGASGAAPPAEAPDPAPAAGPPPAPPAPDNGPPLARTGEEED
ncbi:MAG: hypothetical protein F4Y71_04595 [Acidobacteria bacterium]|nr:hypothetical protein [Acidobacteriota bacterium]MYG75787.1 hypothetical protein [Acidobacteriota bacterium]